MTEPTNIADAITAAQGRVADCYTAISNKGGTLPQTQNLANMPTAIGSISTSKYGVSIENMLGSVDSDGVLQLPTNTSGDIIFTGVKGLSDNSLYYKFYINTNLECGVSLPDLEVINGSNALYYAFYQTHITSVSLPKLKTISGSKSLYYAFYQTHITSLSLPELETVSGEYALYYLASGCPYLTSASFPKLKTVSGNYGLYSLLRDTKITTISFPSLETVSGILSLQYLGYNCQLLETAYFEKLSNVPVIPFADAFGNCPAITDIYFNALTTTSFGTVKTQFNNMFNSSTAATSGNVNVHFPSNLETTISGLIGYPLFGGSSGRVTLLFDLPATS